MKALKPPSSIEAEQSVLGGLLLNNRAFFDIADRIEAGDFYRREHQVIYRGISALIGASRPCDFVTLAEHLRGRAEIDAAGGAEYLASLATDAYSIVNLVAYAGVVREKAVLRELIAVGTELSMMGYHPEGQDAGALLERAETLVLSVRRRAASSNSDVQPYSTFVAQAERRIEAASSKGGQLGGLSTGFPELDAKLDGLHPGDLVLIAARPGMGKTTLAMNIAEHVALARKRRVLVKSMEMMGEQIALRSIAAASGVSLQNLRGGRLDQGEWDRIVHATSMLRTDLIELDESPARTPMDIRAKVRRACSKGDLGLVVVDYAQLMALPDGAENRTNELAEISRSLKAMAKELAVPVILLSQLNRGVENRDNKRPRLNDLRDSGGLEADADAVLFVYRDEVYDEQSIDRSTAEIIIGKQRQGPTGLVRLGFNGELCRFENLTAEQHMEIRRAHENERRERAQRKTRGLASYLERGAA